MKIKIHLKPEIDSITISQEKLNLSDDEMKDMVEVLKYIRLYHTPEGFTATGFDYIKE